MRTLKPLILTSALLFLIPPGTAAQVTGLEKGDKIRVTAPEQLTHRTTGVITDISRDSLRFMHRDSLFQISLSKIQKLEFSTGKKRSAGRGALIGAGSLGLALGLIFMSTDENCSSDEEWCIDLFSRSDSFKIGLVSGALLGGASGAIVGHFILRDRWEKVEFEPVALISASNRSIPAIGIRVQM